MGGGGELTPYCMCKFTGRHAGWTGYLALARGVFVVCNYYKLVLGNTTTNR